MVLLRPNTGTPRRHRFGLVSREEAETAYHEWIAARLRDEKSPMVWSAIRDYLRESRRSGSDLMFITEKGMPTSCGELSHQTND